MYIDLQPMTTANFRLYGILTNYCTVYARMLVDFYLYTLMLMVGAEIEMGE